MDRLVRRLGHPGWRGLCGGDDPAPEPPDPSPGRALVRGTVTGGRPVPGAVVALVDAFEATESDSVDPIENLAARTEVRATTDRDGAFELEAPEGRYFIHVTPPEGDEHLPGGSLARESIDLAGGATAILGIELSERPPEDATFVGSSRCLDCHTGHAGVASTLHRVGLRRLSAAGGVTTTLQDLSAFPDHDVALESFVDGNPNDNTGAGDELGRRVDTSNGYRIVLGRDATGYFQAIETDDGAAPSERLYVEFTYGGEGIYRQLFVTRLDAEGRYTDDPSFGAYQVLPAQFAELRGEPSRGDVTGPGWTLHEPERWGPPIVAGGAASVTPSVASSFDQQCAGCHYTGMAFEESGDGLVRATAVSDPNGALDVDGDGNPDEVNIGCESCHGPGSRHVAEARGFIVRPDYLTQERADMICGACHLRGRGRASGDGLTPGEFPSRGDAGDGLELFRPGLSPAEFFGVAAGSGRAARFRSGLDNDRRFLRGCGPGGGCECQLAGRA